ncbi:restriction endonuclease subunit S [Klebsiella pneumoniae]
MSQYKAYTSYKDSGVEWIGQVPEHWEVKRLRHVGRYSNSGVDKKSYEDQQTVELCNYTDVYYNEFISDDMPFMQATASAHEIEQFTLKKGDVIITKDSEDPSDIGIPAFVPHDMPGVVCGYHLTMIRALNDNYGSYIHRSIQSDHTRAHFFVESPGITRYGLNQNTIGNAPVALPPPEEQATIAATLDRETARIDALVEKKIRFIELLKEKRQALITHAVTKGLDPNAKMKDSGIEWIGQVPEHWKIAQIKRISALNPRKSTLNEEKDSLCTFLPMEKLRTNAVTLDETRPIHEVYGGYSYFCDGDILIAKVTPCFENGNIAVANGLVNGIGFGSTEINVLRVNGKGHNRFLYYRLQEEQFRTIAKSEMRGTGGLKRVPTELFESFAIGLPDTDEQATIAATLDRETARIDALIGKAEQSITLLKERRAAFITAAVTGQIDLRGKQ